MDISVFPVAEVFGVFVHGDFWAIKDRRLVHVVPGEEVKGRALVLRREEVIGPVPSDSRVGEVQPGRRSYTRWV